MLEINFILARQPPATASKVGKCILENMGAPPEASSLVLLGL
jgi:hypothetical protein